MENIISYFGTYTAAADGAIATFKFEYLCSLGFAAIVMFLGRFIVSKSEWLRKVAIPAPVISGLIFSIVVSCIKGAGIIGISFEVATLKDLAQNIFFLCVGFGFSAKMLSHAGGKLCVMIALAACILITCQDILGFIISQVINLHPLLALQCSSASMSGGVGTASAFGPIFESWGAEDATVVGVAAGTMGNIMGSIIGGPVAVHLIKKHGLHPDDPTDVPESAKSTEIEPVNNGKFIDSFALVLLLSALGMPIYCLLDNIPMIEMPKFIGCLFAGAIARNVMEAAGMKFYPTEIEAIEHMWLELYLALVLMTTDFVKLAPLAGKMAIVLVAQGIFTALIAMFLFYYMFGGRSDKMHDRYGAALMVGGNIGWGCGSGSNAVANEKALMDQYGYHGIAWILYPSFAVIIDDIYNPIFLSLFGSLIA